MKAFDARRSKWPLAVLLVVIAAGCGEADRPPDLRKKTTTIEALPEPVKAAASKALKGVKLSDAWENRDRSGKLDSYEVRGTIPSTGKVREARVSPDGRVLEIE